MNSSRRDRHERSLSERSYADDGIDPRTYFANKDRKIGHAAGRLRRAAQQASELIFGFELRDPLLSGFEVTHVTLIRGGKGVEIKVAPPQGLSPSELHEISDKLPAVARIIQAELAQNLQRRRALEVVIRLDPTGGAIDD